MKPMLVKLLLVLIVAVAVVACGGAADDPRLEEYFRALDGLVNRNAGSLALEEQIEERMFSANSTEERVAASKEYFALALEEIDEYIERLGALEPPTEVAAAHDEQLRGLEDVAAFTRQLIAALDYVESESDLELMIAGYVGSFEPLRPSCRQLEQVAEDHGIEVELKCELDENV